MFAVLGLGFPVYFDQGRNLGALSPDIPPAFQDYVERLIPPKRRQIFIVIYDLMITEFRRRFVTRGRAINPETEQLEQLPSRIYIYPETRSFERVTRNTLAIGVRLHLKRLVFFPLVVLRRLTETEAQVVHQWASKSTRYLNLLEQIQFTRDIGLTILSTWSLSDQQMGLRLMDPNLRGERTYCVLLDQNAHFAHTNVCVYPNPGMFLIEFVLLLREQGSLVIYSESNYDWIQI